MSASISIRAYATKDNPEFQKHLKAVKFCHENGLSYPKETEDFFKGKVGGSDDLDDFDQETTLELIEKGIEIPLTTGFIRDSYNEIYKIKVSQIPKEVDEIVIELS